MTVRLDELLKGFQELRLESQPVIVHASLKAFGKVEGGAQAVVNALLETFDPVIMPAFTYKSMVTPLTGPSINGLTYGSGADLNRMAEFFSPDMPADPLMGIIAETLRKHPRARRSSHPILSFAGVNARTILATQKLNDPFLPINALENADGWVLLLGVDHTVNTAIHCAEKQAGRRRFIRWALTPRGVVECHNFPGCSAGFGAIAPDVDRYTRYVSIGSAVVQAVPLKMLFRAVRARIKKDPLALLCQQEDCERCQAVRDSVQ